MLLVGLAEMCEKHLFAQTLYLCIVDDDKLLVGWRVYKELISLSLEDIFHPHSHLNGVFRELEVKVVGEKGIELQAYKCSLGYYGLSAASE